MVLIYLNIFPLKKYTICVNIWVRTINSESKIEEKGRNSCCIVKLMVLDISTTAFDLKKIQSNHNFSFFIIDFIINDASPKLQLQKCTPIFFYLNLDDI